MKHPLLLKLDRSGALRELDREQLKTIFAKEWQVAARADIVREGDSQKNVHIILDGMACRYKLMPSGKRAILACIVPGDLCDLQHMILGKMDYSIAALTPCILAEASRADLEELCARRPGIGRALWRTTLVDEAILRGWLLRGQLSADKRLACLISELRLRLETVGLVENGTTFKFNLTQEELADMLGITAVHVNRVMQQLREMGLVYSSGRSLTIPDFRRLENYAEFDAAYLHLQENAGSKS